MTTRDRCPKQQADSNLLAMMPLADHHAQALCEKRSLHAGQEAWGKANTHTG
jgi:hypothetical protein